VKTVSVCVLLFLLSIVAYSGLSDAPTDYGQLIPGVLVSPSVAAAPVSLNTPVDVAALDVSSGMPASDFTRNPERLAANLSAYVFVHHAWNESISAPTTPRSSVCRNDAPDATR